MNTTRFSKYVWPFFNIMHDYGGHYHGLISWCSLKGFVYFTYWMLPSRNLCNHVLFQQPFESQQIGRQSTSNNITTASFCYFWRNIYLEEIIEKSFNFLSFFVAVTSKIESNIEKNVKDTIEELDIWKNINFSLYISRYCRSSHLMCFIEKVFLQILQIHRKTPVLESLF